MHRFELTAVVNFLRIIALVEELFTAIAFIADIYEVTFGK